MQHHRSVATLFISEQVGGKIIDGAIGAVLFPALFLLFVLRISLLSIVSSSALDPCVTQRRRPPPPFIDRVRVYIVGRITRKQSCKSNIADLLAGARVGENAIFSFAARNRSLYTSDIEIFHFSRSTCPQIELEACEPCSTVNTYRSRRVQWSVCSPSIWIKQ